jgi:hypothetical protein
MAVTARYRFSSPIFLAPDIGETNESHDFPDAHAISAVRVDITRS